MTCEQHPQRSQSPTAQTRPIKASDAVYISGGSTPTLQRATSQLNENQSQLLKLTIKHQPREEISISSSASQPKNTCQVCSDRVTEMNNNTMLNARQNTIIKTWIATVAKKFIKIKKFIIYIHTQLFGGFKVNNNNYFIKY